MTAPRSLDLTPAPGAAPAGRRVLRHARTEARLLVRNGEQLLLALVIPMGSSSWRAGSSRPRRPRGPRCARRAGARPAGLGVHLARDRDRIRAPLRRAGAAGGDPARPHRAAHRQGAGRRRDRARPAPRRSALVAAALGWRPTCDRRLAPRASIAAVSRRGRASAVSRCSSPAAAGRGDARRWPTSCTSCCSPAAPCVVRRGALPRGAPALLDLLPTAALGECLRAGAVGAVLWPLLVAAGLVRVGRTRRLEGLPMDVVTGRRAARARRGRPARPGRCAAGRSPAWSRTS